MLFLFKEILNNMDDKQRQLIRKDKPKRRKLTIEINDNKRDVHFD
jgi:hypothetical protein